MPDAMARLASGDDKALRQRRPPERQSQQIHDERERVLIAGTNNRDSRAVYDARVLELKQSVAAEELDTVGQRLLDIEHLALFRARNVVNFPAFATSVVGLPLEQATQLVSEAAARAGWDRGRLPDPLIALWIRTEAALREHLGHAAVRLTGSAVAPALEIVVPCAAIDKAVSALSGVGRQAAGLAYHLAKPRAPRTPRDQAEDRASTATASEPKPPSRRRYQD